MGKPKKVQKKYNYNKNRKKEWKRRTKKANIGCKQLKNAWDEDRTLNENLTDFGLVANPNKALSLPKTKDQLGVQSDPVVPKKKARPVKAGVVDELESVANAPQPKTLKFSDPDVRYCIYMMEKYDEDYKAMARDEKNYYQDTPKQIRRKINQFKNIPAQYQEYLASKNKTETMDIDK